MSQSPVSERQILEALHQAPAERWSEVLAFLHQLQAPESGQPRSTPWTAAELLKLPVAEREVILAEQATRAAADYAGDPELTA